MGGATIVPRSLKTKWNKKFQDRPKFLKSSITLLYLLIICKFSKIRSINCNRDDFMCQSWAKLSKFIPFSLRLSGIEFSLV
jgi:hypothetical protein